LHILEVEKVEYPISNPELAISKAIAASCQPISSDSDQNSSSMQREALLTKPVMSFTQSLIKLLWLRSWTRVYFGSGFAGLGLKGCKLL